MHEAVPVNALVSTRVPCDEQCHAAVHRPVSISEDVSRSPSVTNVVMFCDARGIETRDPVETAVDKALARSAAQPAVNMAHSIVVGLKVNTLPPRYGEELNCPLEKLRAPERHIAAVTALFVTVAKRKKLANEASKDEQTVDGSAEPTASW